MTSPKTIIQTDGELIYYPDIFTAFNWKEILDQVQWQHNDIRIFGKTYKEPRLTAWYGPAYKYSSVEWPASPFPLFLGAMRDKISSLCNFEFNAVLLNYYRHGQDSMGWHRDNEKEIDQRCIASVSFGETRSFLIKHRSKEIREKLELENGSLLLMNDFQEHWEHAVPKRSKVEGGRLNLTFRRIINP